MSSVDFVTTLLRGTEWAATGRVTQKVPSDFPANPDVLAYRTDLAKIESTGAPPPAPGPPAAAAGRGPSAITESVGCAAR